ncbi:MAG: DUF4255 domain-containing protein [Polyangiaceae bacterium]|nr:DUF4255 domain-containing protein [Polyangiaceae bacterium]
MVREILLLLKNLVNAHLAASLDGDTFEQEPVVFLESEKLDVLEFKLGAVTLLLVNLEEEHAVRPADPHRRTLPDGSIQKVSPPILLNLYVLFVARFKEYLQGARYISQILQFFLKNRVLDHENTPALSDTIDKLTVELLSLPFAEQNHLWGILRTAYQPSLLYKVRMAAFLDEEGVTPPVITDPTHKVIRL